MRLDLFPRYIPYNNKLGELKYKDVVDGDVDFEVDIYEGKLCIQSFFQNENNEPMGFRVDLPLDEVKVSEQEIESLTRSLQQ